MSTNSLSYITHSNSNSDHHVLYEAQKKGQDVFKTALFPHFSTEYIQSQSAFVGGILWGYNKVYEGASAIGECFQGIWRTVEQVHDMGLGWIERPVADALYPINPINGKRHWVIPRSLEKMLGDWLFYPLASARTRKTYELLEGTHEPIAEKVESILQRLCQENQDLLNPSENSTQFNYRVKTVHSSGLNAFAVPGGGMVVFSQLVKELHGATRGKQIKETKVEFADGSYAIVDLTGVTLDDVIAALLGHEMTHAASRHSMAAMVAQFVHRALFGIGRIVIGSMGSIENEEGLDALIEWFQDKASFLESLFRSRCYEYEADVTGVYFAKRSGFNPLGALYLQTLLQDNELFGIFHKYFEFFYTHPHGDNRKRALFASITHLAPESLKGKMTQWNVKDHSAYSSFNLSPAYRFPSEAARALENVSI